MDVYAWQKLLLLATLWLLFSHSATFGTDLVPGNPGSISIDCGADEDYYDEATGIFYTSDRDFISTGNNHDVSPEYDYNTPYLERMLKNLRSFPQGKKNCYTLQPLQGKNQSYYIQFFFRYGNYDAKNQIPKFDIYVGVNYWATVDLESASQWASYGIIHFSLTDTIFVCLVNTGSGVPFISGLELRFSNYSWYEVDSGSLANVRHYDFGNLTDTDARYKDDIFNFLWIPRTDPDWISFNATSDTIIRRSADSYNPPVEVLRSAAQPKSGFSSLSFDHSWSFPHSYKVYFHFVEIVDTAATGQRREFSITLNGVNYGPFTLEYLKLQTICTPKSPFPGKVQFSINSTKQSDLPPILNALEIVLFRKIDYLPTDQADVQAIMAIKRTYELDRIGWQGDPCIPRDFSWDGLECRNYNNTPRIISLDLSSSKLAGEITPLLFNLKAIQSLDLSYNELNGTVPEFLAQLPNLTILNLIGNNLMGPVPLSLIEKSNKGILQLRLDINTNPCQSDHCERKKQRSLLPIIASVASVLMLLLLAIIAYFWRLKTKREKIIGSTKGSSLKVKNQPFTYSEIISITNNFRNIIGEGGFGKVYFGNLKDCTQVAVKLLSQSSKQGYKEFLAEVQLLMVVYHRNLVSLIGCCKEHENMALVYEYMANGNLRQHLSDRSRRVLNWRERLQIAVDAAHGLEYLHNGCKPSIIHRDLKSSNILLDENLQAKICDFGLSRVFAAESDTHVTTCPAGTPGYLDPEFQATGNLNRKSDVYSFGVVLFELITGLSVSVRRDDEYSIHILEWVSPIIASGDIQSIVDPRLQREFDPNSAWKVVEIAMSCVPSTAIQRPDMSHVLAELKECLAMEMTQTTQNNSIRMSNSLEMSAPTPR